MCSTPESIVTEIIPAQGLLDRLNMLCSTPEGIVTGIICMMSFGLPTDKPNDIMQMIPVTMPSGVEHNILSRSSRPCAGMISVTMLSGVEHIQILDDLQKHAG